MNERYPNEMHRQYDKPAPQAQAKPSRWARASREELEELAEFVNRYWGACKTCPQLEALRASCPPLRTEAEVAAEALAVLRDPNARFADTDVGRRLRALAKEPTR
jgi:hypothetical protein